jgi:hypothetical protein
MARGEYRDGIERVTVTRGCDLFATAAEHHARNGLIYAIISNEDASKISAYKLPGSTVSYTKDSWIGADINDNKVIYFKEPVEYFTISAGSFWAFYC